LLLLLLLLLLPQLLLLLLPWLPRVGCRRISTLLSTNKTTMRDYDPDELCALDRTAHLVFARDDLVMPGTGAPGGVRHHDTLVTFNVYPRSDRDVELNELLWRVVRDSSFKSTELAPYLARKRKSPDAPIGVVFALAIPLKLIHFLEAVTLEEMHSSVIHMLADAAQGEDEDGLELMRHELSPAIWTRLEPVLLDESGCCESRADLPTSDAAGDHSSCERQGVMCNKYASSMLDMALQSSHAQNYWSVDIQGTLFEPYHQAHCDTHSDNARQPSHNNDRAAVTHSLYLDWRVYARVCMVMDTTISNISSASADQSSWSDNDEIPRWTSGDSPSETAVKCRLILDTLLQLVSEQRHAATWERAQTLLLCANRSGNKLHTLPEHVIHHEILPRMVLEEPARSEDSPGAHNEHSVVKTPALDIGPGACLSNCPALLPRIVDDEEMQTENNMHNLGLVLDGFEYR
jgi:hypothetical protein